MTMGDLTSGPLRRLLAVNVCVLLAVMVVLNRDRLPWWLKVELYPSRQQAQLDRTMVAMQGKMFTPAQAVQVREMMRPRIRLHGRPVLVVGDSSVAYCPWGTDLISLPGKTAQDIGVKLAGLLEGRQYEQVVLWPGTAHFRDGLSVDAYVDAVRDMTARAEAAGARVLIVLPMPYDDLARAIQDYGRSPWNTVEAIAAARRRLRKELPRATVFDTAAWRDEIIRDHLFRTYTLDGVHLSPAGFAVLGRRLDERGFHVAPA